MTHQAAPQNTYLITGANKGIGRSIVHLLLQRPNTTVVAAVRFPDNPTSQALHELPTATGSRLVILELRTDEHFTSLPDTLKAHEVTNLDAVIANAGTSAGFKSVLDTPPTNLLSDYEVNAVGPLKLFQACWPLYRGVEDEKSGIPSGLNKFVLMSSSVGSIASLAQESFPTTSYGMSKAAANWLTTKIAVEFKDKNLAAFCLHPGWVGTDMGCGLADALHVGHPAMDADESARKCLEQIDGLDMAKSGSFVAYNGITRPW